MNELIDTTGGVRPGFAARRLLAIAVLIGGASMSACDDDPVDPHGHEEGIDGFALVVGGTELYEYRASVHGLTPDLLVLEPGQSYAITITWLDDEGHATEPEEDLELVVTFATGTALTWTTTSIAAGTLQTGTPASDLTDTMTIELMHGDHPDFTIGIPLSIDVP